MVSGIALLGHRFIRCCIGVDTVADLGVVGHQRHKRRYIFQGFSLPSCGRPFHRPSVIAVGSSTDEWATKVVPERDALSHSSRGNSLNRWDIESPGVRRRVVPAPLGCARNTGCPWDNICGGFRHEESWT